MMIDESQLPPRQYIRILYAKGEAVKFISHHDEFRLWERALRRADLPLLYKQGFNPQPHMQFAAPLGVGITGAREPLDIVLASPLPVEEVTARLRAKLPPGVSLVDVRELPGKPTALQNLIIGADYAIVLYAEPGEIDGAGLQARIDRLLATDEIWRVRERKGKPYAYNLRPLVLDLRYTGYDAATEEHRIFLRVQQRSGATGRPDEVVDALGFDDFARTLRRDRLYFDLSDEDLAVFAAYPVVEQEEVAISSAKPKRRRHRGKSKPASKQPTGR
ncbi:MAG: TIGR03936 family radical SAM-associated protein, partial [Caldilineaceae bacterium]|nr:TIGR03936 family radical SAM-associated protein [Caldilineaceae bacterium]